MKRAFEFGLVLLVTAGLGTCSARASSGGEGYAGLYLLAGAANGGGHSVQGYLGVNFRDVAEERVAVLRLKDARGAEITLVDHDAPAGKAGLRERDVVLQLNGQAIEGEEQLRRLLRELAPGRTVVLLYSRDGMQMTATTQMANREEVERKAWEDHLTVPEPPAPPVQLTEDTEVPAQTAPQGPSPRGGSSFLGGALTINSSYTGAIMEKMSGQLASYFGVATGAGLLVRSVVANSPAAQAGLHAGDVVVKAGDKQIATPSEWAKAIKGSHGRPVTVTVLRDRKEQTLTLTPDGKKRSSLEPDTELSRDAEPTMMAHLGFSWMGAEAGSSMSSGIRQR